MLDQLFVQRFAVDRRRSGLLGPHLDLLTQTLLAKGYCTATVKKWLAVLRDLERWLARNGLAVADLQEALLERFLEYRSDWRRRQGRARFTAPGARTVYFLLDHLRRHGVVDRPKMPTDHSPLGHLGSRYADYLTQRRGLSSATFQGYWPTVTQLLIERFGDQAIVLGHLTRDDVSAFLLRHARDSTPAQAKRMVTALRSFFRFLFQEGETKTNLIGAVPTIRTWRFSGVPKYLRPDEVQRVIDGCNEAHATARRDRALLLLLARLGLRAGEVISLELDDINWRAGVLTIRGKGRFHDRLPLPTDVGRALAAYLRRDRPQCDSRRVFVRIRAPHQGHANSSTISTIVRRALERVGLHPPLKGAHLLRHSLATGMLRQGASMAQIGQILRHRSAQSTEIYAKVDTAGLRSVARPWPGRAGKP